MFGCKSLFVDMYMSCVGYTRFPLFACGLSSAEMSTCLFSSFCFVCLDHEQMFMPLPYGFASEH
jgi:hypothetical protein